MSDAAAPVSTPAPTESGEQNEVENREGGKETAPEPKPQKRFLKTKVNGREVSVDEETLLRDYSKYAAGDELLKQAAKGRQSIEAFWEAFQKDPRKVLSDPRLPIDRKQLAMDLMREQMEAEMLENDPQAQKLTEQEKRLKYYEEKEAREKAEQEQSQYDQVVTTRREAIASTLTKALELTPLSKNPEVQAETLREMAAYLRLARQSGYDVSPEDLAQHVSRNKLSSYRTLADQMDGDELIEFFGREDRYEAEES